MPAKNLSLQHFYPAELEITEVLESADKIIIKLKSHTHSCKCPTCGTVSTKYHGTYICQVQDLPILGKNIELKPMLTNTDVIIRNARFLRWQKHSMVF